MLMQFIASNSAYLYTVSHLHMSQNGGSKEKIQRKKTQILCTTKKHRCCSVYNIKFTQSSINLFCFSTYGGKENLKRVFEKKIEISIIRKKADKILLNTPS